MKLITVLAVAVALTSCLPIERAISGTPNPCSLGDTRCADNVVQTCGANFRWVDAQRCDQLASGKSTRWSCAPFEGVHACLPVASGDAGAATH
jgi:hypothetical protein